MAVAAVGHVELTYWFYFTAGKFKDAPIYNNYYDLLAEGFRSGHLYLAVLPDPRLLAVPDPHAFHNWPLWLTDMSLYAGKYYLYWGPVPALLQAIAKSMFQINGIIGDQYLTFSFLSGSALCGALLLDRVTRRLFPSVPRWLVVLGMAAFAFANPIVYLIVTPGVYQAAITGGQVFVLAGLLFAFDAVWCNAEPSRSRRRLVVSGIAFALALGCRISLGPCVALLIAATALAVSWPSETRPRTLLWSAVCQGTPAALGVFALLGYNKLRFDEWLEFGTGHQLTTVPLRISSAYVPANLWSYMLAPFHISCRFPFAIQSWVSGPKGLPAWIATPWGYLMEEPVSGFLRAVPLTWLLPFAVVGGVSQALLLRHEARSSEQSRRRLGYLWCALCFALLGSASGAVILGFYFATMRYLVDVTFGLVALSLLGGYSLVAYAPTKLRRIVSAGVFSSLAASTIVLGLLLGYQGYNDHFKRFNPELDAKIVNALSICPRGRGRNRITVGRAPREDERPSRAVRAGAPNARARRGRSASIRRTFRFAMPLPASGCGPS